MTSFVTSDLSQICDLLEASEDSCFSTHFKSFIRRNKATRQSCSLYHMAVVPPSGSACAFVLCCSFLVLIRFSVAHRELPDYFTDFDGGECEFEPGRGRIIRARDSERRGARFLNSVTSEAQSVCFQSCCETTSCDLAVYRRPTANGKHNCFLFFCDTPSLCVFAVHPGYTSSERRLKKTDLLPVTGSFDW